jgi:hypothetical protein
VLLVRSRRTSRLECIIHHLGLALGGRPGASFAKRLMLPVSNDTVLRVVRARARPRTGDRIDEVMAVHLQEAAIVEAFLPTKIVSIAVFMLS